MNLLFLSRWLPYPADNGSKLRIYNILKQLASRGHQIHLIFMHSDNEDTEAGVAHLNEFCAQVEFLPFKPFIPGHWKALVAFLSPWPRSVKSTFVPELAARVDELLASGNIDRVVACQLDMAYYGLQASKYGVPAFLEEIELGALYDYIQQQKGLKNQVRYGLTWLKQTNYLRHLARHFQALTVVSQKEKELVSRVTGETPVYILPNGADLELNRFKPYRSGERLPQVIYNGALTFHLNYQAVAYYLAKIAPLLKEQASLKLVVTGKYSGVNLEGLPAFEASEVELTGFVENIRPLITQSLICVIPLLEGGGSRLKLLEAFALGTPVVSTSKGVEGIPARHEEHLLIADTPQEFADAVLRLYRESALAQRLAANARQLVERDFNWPDIVEKLDSIITAGAERPLALAKGAKGSPNSRLRDN